ncbi:head-to-tail connector complex protein [Gordonia phage Fryberger]|uniref:Head-to-tail adaptor n=1 Tax=Gordonia phage Fryberger TaxID=2250392 RepID=A0A346FCJ4_9CAUD|nr:head-to-tail connector complex protein [Gordonia phage Fryberger]AXN53458.1 head-to-tail adaptor [Gordonia phage Fryberger]
MALATIDDLVLVLDRELEAGETQKATGYLEIASALVEGYCQTTFTSPVPRPVALATAMIAARRFEYPAAATNLGGEVEKSQYVMGPFQGGFTYAGKGSKWYVGAAEKIMLDPYAAQSFQSVVLGSERGFYEWEEDES